MYVIVKERESKGDVEGVLLICKRTLTQFSFVIQQ